MSQRDKPRLALNNNTTGVRERSEWSGGPSDIEGKTTRVGASECGQRTSFNRTRVAGHLDEIQGVVALNLFRNGAVGFIDWLDSISFATHRSNESGKVILPFLSNPKVTPDEPPCPSEANPA